MEKAERFLDKYIIIFFLLLTIPATWSLFKFGFFGVSDDLHIGWLHQMHRAISMGQFPARYVPDLSYGFGYPLFNFYAPLPFYIGEIFHNLGFSLVDSIKALFLISLPLSGYFMYKLLREFGNPFVSLFGGLLYVYTPYRATDIFVRGAVGEATVFIFIPLVVLSFIKVFKSQNLDYKSIGLGGLSLALLITSHNITALILYSLLIPLFLIYLYFSKQRLMHFLSTLYVSLLGLLISSFFWVPAIVESGLVKYDTVFNYWDHFPTLRQLVTPYFGHGASVPGPYDLMSFYAGIVNVSLIIAGTVLVFKINKVPVNIRPFMFWLVLISMISVFFMNHRSAFLWENLPLIAYFQFPWRFLTIITFASAGLAVLLSVVKKNRIFSVILILVVIGINYSYFRPESFLGRTDEYYIDRYIPFPNASEAYKQTGEEYLRLPQDTQIRPSENYPRFYSDQIEIKNIEIINPLNARAHVVSSGVGLLNYNKYNYPGWVVEINGVNTPIETGTPYGQIAVVVPEGEHLVEVRFSETPFRTVFNFISVSALIVAAILIIKGIRK